MGTPPRYTTVDALSAAGVPVYGEPGAPGGFALLDSYRTNLTGLTEGEVRALFILNIPTPLTELGVSQDLRSALLKLAATLPDTRRSDEATVHQRFHLDAAWWQQDQERVPHLQTIHEAVWQDRKIQITYQPIFATQVESGVGLFRRESSTVGEASAQRMREYGVKPEIEVLDVGHTEQSYMNLDIAQYIPACARHKIG